MPETVFGLPLHPLVNDAAVALRWARVGYLFAALIPAAIFHFATTLAQRRRRDRTIRRLFWVVSVSIGFTAAFTNLLIPDVRVTPFDGVFPGVETRSFDAPALPAGSYTWVCTVHPNMQIAVTAQ